ncbi:MAG: hypothetical protein JXA42_04515 [Anaerolineales bacterium]|nr:hypothetical protein [Anaerolineales bacterium]
MSTELGTEYQERLKRFNDAVALRKPDRVPFFPCQQLFPARYVGITYEEAFYDVDAWLSANEKMIVDYDLDMFWSPGACILGAGKANEILGLRQLKWPGHGVSATSPFQFVEGEYMKAEEYDEFLNDPGDWTIRKYLPRIFGSLEGLSMLPPLTTMLFGYVGVGVMGVMAAPPVAAAFQALSQAAQVSGQWSMATAQFIQKMKGLGYPAWGEAVAIPPFDLIGDMLRGMRGSMLDMYRNPDKLLAATEKVTPVILGGAIGAAQMTGNPRVFIALHRGADGFMSNEQFEKFYWPTLKAVILGLIEAGLTPCPFFEGIYDQRLQYLKELPPGKVMGLFDRSDLALVKKELGDIMCIAGGMPVTLLQTGTPELVRDETKKLIETVGRDGGFIMSSNTSLDEVDPKLVKVWMEATQEYGVY